MGFSGLDDLGNTYTGAGIQVLASGTWQNGSGLGTTINFWGTNPGETFARNLATIQGFGYWEFDRYPFLPNEGIPDRLLGFEDSSNAARVEPFDIVGLPAPGDVIQVDAAGTALQWGQPTGVGIPGDWPAVEGQGGGRPGTGWNG